MQRVDLGMTDSFAAAEVPGVTEPSSSFRRQQERRAAIPAVYNEVFDRNWAPLFRLATLMTGSRSDAEEVAQEAFTRWYARRSSIENPDAFLRTVVITLANGRHRRRTVAKKYAHLFVEDPTSNETFVNHTEILALLGRLPARQRAAVVLRFYERRTEAEIATILNCRPGTVKSLLSRALDELRRVVTNHDQS